MSSFILARSRFCRSVPSKLFYAHFSLIVPMSLKLLPIYPSIDAPSISTNKALQFGKMAERSKALFQDRSPKECGVESCSCQRISVPIIPTIFAMLAVQLSKNGIRVVLMATRLTTRLQTSRYQNWLFFNNTQSRALPDIHGKWCHILFRSARPNP